MELTITGENITFFKIEVLSGLCRYHYLALGRNYDSVHILHPLVVFIYLMLSLQLYVINNPATNRAFWILYCEATNI